MTSKIIREHGGIISFRSVSERGHSGKVFSVFFPPANDIPAISENRRLVLDEARTHVLSAWQMRTISHRLIAENHRLSADIHAQARRFNRLRQNGAAFK
jgi:hypothetical protein